jgi:hypothetical protein
MPEKIDDYKKYWIKVLEPDYQYAIATSGTGLTATLFIEQGGLSQ